MINNSWAEYAFIRVCIFGLQAIGPVAVAYTASTILLPSFRSWAWSSTPGKIAGVWLTAEAIFHLFFIPVRHWYLQREAEHPPLYSRDGRQELFERVLANTQPKDLEKYICGWFRGAKIEEIGRQDVKRWIGWAFFEGRVDDVKGAKEELEAYTTRLEQLLGTPFKPGCGKAIPLCLTLDPVNMSHRSLLWYWMVGFVDFLTYTRMARLGFYFHRQPYSDFFKLFPLRPVALTARKKSPSKTISYWFRPHTSKTKLPIVFIHGIGIGLYPYVNFMREVQSVDAGDDGQVGILAIELMQISFRLTPSLPPREALCGEILKVLEHHSITRYVLISHSYGSVLITHLLNHRVNNSSYGTLSKPKPTIASIILIDPVTFLLHTPSVAYNFTARPPRDANEWQLWYFASQDPMVAYTLGRHFFWMENVLWLEEDLMPLVKEGMRVTVSLSGRDLIVDTEAVGRYLARSVEFEDGEDVVAWKKRAWSGKGLDVLWFDDTDHAQVFDTPQKRARLVDVTKAYCEGG